MNKYELTVLVSSTDGVEDKIEKLVKTLGGKAGRMIEMGKKQLAYPINKINEANYLFWTLELEPKSVTLIDRKLTNDSTILRHLVVKI